MIVIGEPYIVCCLIWNWINTYHT